MSNEQVIMLPKVFVHAEYVPVGGAIGEVRLSGTKEGFAMLRDQLTDFLENEVVPGTFGGFVAAGMIPWTFKCIQREKQISFQVTEPIIDQPMEHTLVEPPVVGLIGEPPVCNLCNGTGQVQAAYDVPAQICPCRETPPNARAALTPELMQEMCDKFFDGMVFKAPGIESLLYESDYAARVYRNTNKDGCHDGQLAAIAKQRSELIDAYNEAVKSSEKSPSPKEPDHAHSHPRTSPQDSQRGAEGGPGSDQ